MTPSPGALRLIGFAFFLAPRLFANIDPTPLQGRAHASKSVFLTSEASTTINPSMLHH
jgi:hypothetical protein